MVDGGSPSEKFAHGNKKSSDSYRVLISNKLIKFWQEHPEAKENLRNYRAKQILPMRDTLIEIKIQNFLKSLNMEFFTHQYIKDIEHGYQCDILIPVQEGINQKTIIECDGDFVHCNPLKYSSNFVRFPTGKNIITAEEIWEKDQAKTKELIEKGFKVIRLWESEIEQLDLNKFQEKLQI
jgi:G:T-mismatch repair DNA endonuclease (very short patch repair protein)